MYDREREKPAIWCRVVDEDIDRHDGTYQPFKHNVHIYLDEQDNRTTEQRATLKPNGFTEYASVKDYPVRNRLLTLHIRRRRYLDADDKSFILSEIFKKEELDNRPVTSRSVGRSHGIDGDYLGQVYKDHLSDYEHWDQKAHAKEWILIAKNMGRHLSIDECMYCGRLYTFVSNKDAHGGRGTIIAIIAGVKAATVLRWLLEIPEEERRGVLDVSMDFSDSMKLIAKTAFPSARISLDRFHVFQDLSKYFMKAFSDVRDKVLVAIKHEKAMQAKMAEEGLQAQYDEERRVEDGFPQTLVLHAQDQP